MTDTYHRELLSDGIRDAAVSLVDLAAVIKDGADIGDCLTALRACGSCLHLAEMTLLHIDQIEAMNER